MIGEKGIDEGRMIGCFAAPVELHQHAQLLVAIIGYEGAYTHAGCPDRSNQGTPAGDWCPECPDVPLLAKAINLPGNERDQLGINSCAFLPKQG